MEHAYNGPHLPGKFVLTEQEDFAADHVDNLALVLRAAVFEYMLHDVVAVLVLDQTVHLIVELLQNGRGLIRHAVLQDTLDHAASVWVRGQSVHL